MYARLTSENTRARFPGCAARESNIKSALAFPKRKVRCEHPPALSLSGKLDYFCLFGELQSRVTCLGWRAEHQIHSHSISVSISYP